MSTSFIDALYDENDPFYSEYHGRGDLTLTLSNEPFEDCFLCLEEENKVFGFKGKNWMEKTASLLLINTLHERSKLKRSLQTDKLQNISYRVFELIEPAIKQAIAQAIEEDLGK
jgi:hypothetical protein